MSGNIQDPYIGRFQDAMIQKYLCISSRDLNDKLKRIDSKNPLKKNVYEIMHKLSDMTSSSNWENTLIYAPNEEWKIRNFITEQNIGLYGIQFDDQMVQIDEPKELIFAGPVNLPEFNLPVLFFFDYDLSEQQVNEIKQLMKSFESEHCNPYSRVTPDVDSLWTRWLRRGIPIPTHRPTFDIEHIDRIAKSERANIRLNSIAQIEALKAMPPLLINGQAGAGKTTVLAHRMAWSVIQHREHRGSDSRILYISYSEALTRQAGEDVRRIIETIHDKKPQIYLANMHFKTMHELLRGDAGGHAKNSQMGFGQFKTWYQQKRAKDHRSRSIPAERAWYAIRLLKGKTASSTRFRMGKEGKEHFLERMNSVAELRRWSESDQEYMFNIILDYQKKLADEKKWDDIDLARAALKRVDNGEKYDEIFCDEAQDFTQIELAYLKQKCSTNPLWPTKANACLNLAGDDMQTINPTGFNWKQYQEDWESQDAPLDMYKLSQNERSDKKIVDLANRFLRVQKELFGREVQQQLGSDFGERMPLFVVDDQGNKMEHQIADWVRKSIQYRDQNFGIIIEKEYEIDVISLLESDSLFQQILDSDLAKDEHIDLPDGTTHNINMAMKKLSDLKSEVEDPRKVNERTNILFTLLQKLRIYRVSDIKGLERRKILLHRMVQNEYDALEKERDQKQYEKQIRAVQNNVDVEAFQSKTHLKDAEQLDLQYRLNRHYISVSRAMTNLLIFEGGDIASRYWSPLISSSKRPGINKEGEMKDFVEIVDDSVSLEAILNDQEKSWVPEQREIQDFDELYKFAQQLRNSAGRDGAPQLLRAIAVLKEAEEENAPSRQKKEDVEDLILQLSAEVAELQKEYDIAAENYATLGQRYIHRRGMSDLGLQFLEKSGDCFRFGQEWEKAVDVYSQIHNWKSVKEGMRVRTKIWEQECKFQSVMNDGTELIKREGTKRSLPPHVLKQNIPESVEQAAETITEYSKFLSDLDESEWELMEVNNGFEHVLNLAYCAQLLLANIGQNEIDDFSQTVSEICLTAVLRTYPDVEYEQDELLSFYLNIRVSQVKDSEPDSLKALFDVISDIISLKPLSNSNAFTNQYEGMDWQKKLAEFAMLVLHSAKQSVSDQSQHEYYDAYNSLISICEKFNQRGGRNPLWLECEGQLMALQRGTKWKDVRTIHERLRDIDSGKWDQWPPGIMAELASGLEDETDTISSLNRKVSGARNAKLIQSSSSIVDSLIRNLSKRFGRAEKDSISGYTSSRISDPYLERDDPVISRKGVDILKNQGRDILTILAQHFSQVDKRRAVFWYIQIENSALEQKEFARAADALYERAKIHIEDRHQQVEPMHYVRALSRAGLYFMWAAEISKKKRENYRENARDISQQINQIASKYSDLWRRPDGRPKLGAFGAGVSLNNAIMFHLRQDRVNSEVVKRYNQVPFSKDSKRDYLKISPSDFADILEKKITEEGADPNSVIENYIEKRRFEDAAEFVQKYRTHEKHIEWASRLAVAAQDWMSKKKNKNQEYEGIVLSRIFTETYGPRRRRKKLREFVEENYSEQHWANVLDTFYEQSDLIDYLWDLVDEGGKVWAEEMFMHVTTKQLEQLKNRKEQLDNIIANTDDLEHKKMAQIEKRDIKQQIRDIEDQHEDFN